MRKDLMTLEDICLEHAALFNRYRDLNDLYENLIDADRKKAVFQKLDDVLCELATCRSLLVNKVMQENGFVLKESRYYESGNN